ncbi:MAG: STAS domain-containing protein [Nitrospirae bacterium]|nr:STAS domain-containing protein [Nitrospirota bacterium]
MEVIAEKSDGMDVISLNGRLDASNASALDEKMKDCLSRKPEKVIISLKGLEYVSSAGLRVFLGIAKEIKMAGGKLAFAEPDANVLKVLKMSGLDTFLKIYKSMDDAVSGLRQL